jgi:hypothetical protein
VYELPGQDNGTEIHRMNSRFSNLLIWLNCFLAMLGLDLWPRVASSEDSNLSIAQGGVSAAVMTVDRPLLREFDDEAPIHTGVGTFLSWWDSRFQDGTRPGASSPHTSSPSQRVAEATVAVVCDDSRQRNMIALSNAAVPDFKAAIPSIEYCAPADLAQRQTIKQPDRAVQEPFNQPETVPYNPMRSPEANQPPDGPGNPFRSSSSGPSNVSTACEGPVAAMLAIAPPNPPPNLAERNDSVEPFPAAGSVVDPINAVVTGSTGTMPPSVLLASQKIPTDPPANTEVLPLPEPVPMNIESPGPPGPEPFLVEPGGVLRRWMSGPKKVGNSQDRGIGYERVADAPFVLDTTNPMTMWALRIDAAYKWRYPDAAEYLFARPTTFGGIGPPEQAYANFQDFDFIGEMGNSSFSTRTSIPVRILDPATGGSTAGMGDVQVATKLVLLAGERLKLTQYLDMYMPTGSAGKGLGTGHFAMEPGLLASYRWSDETYIHAETKYLFPIPTSPGFTGTMLTWGFGVSHLMYDGDAFAVIPTAELVCYTIFDASQTAVDPVPNLQHIDNEVIPTIHLGCRVVSDRFRDIGTVELGVSVGINLGASNWYEDLLRTEVRVLY